MAAKRLVAPRFPSVKSANQDGLVLLGGAVTFDWLREAYAEGIFPWPWVDAGREVLAWYSPDPRAILEFNDFHVSRRLLRRIRRREYRVSIDAAFERVVRACSRRDANEVWITDQLIAGYLELYRLNHAHSVEVWRDQTLVGGVFGVTFGGYFSAESMFSQATDASKFGLAYLVQHLRVCGHALLDAQVTTEHTCSLGVTEMPRARYLKRLKAALKLNVDFSTSVDDGLLDRFSDTG